MYGAAKILSLIKKKKIKNVKNINESRQFGGWNVCGFVCVRAFVLSILIWAGWANKLLSLNFFNMCIKKC